MHGIVSNLQIRQLEEEGGGGEEGEEEKRGGKSLKPNERMYQQLDEHSTFLPTRVLPPH